MSWIIILLASNIVCLALFVAILLIYKVQDHKYSSKLDRLQRFRDDQKKSLSALSHDLRTPLNAIMGYTTLLLNKVHGELSAKQVQDLERISLNSDKILQIIDEFYKVNFVQKQLHKDDLNEKGS
ncbi:MAG: histidine kinase dimerization/phospho-acceptor domain-containing protein [Candidatus Auribacterota bacterium]|jgi:signal transduction histidine kinase|uniref:histidine kinase n=1 Tax=Candidatus Auribacter fodinae TaxID=2093366 RepID=A0A3A4R3F6_9BACT|nr:MAG: hypothetical protein C4541_06750 [Candidatus Auribacter fodinae]